MVRPEGRGNRAIFHLMRSAALAATIKSAAAPGGANRACQISCRILFGLFGTLRLLLRTPPLPPTPASTDLKSGRFARDVSKKRITRPFFKRSKMHRKFASDQNRPKRLQGAPRWPQDGPKKPQDGPKRPQDGPKSAPEGPKRAPRRPQDGSKTAPSRFQDAIKSHFMLS